MYIEGAFITVSDCLVLFMYSVPCDYVLTQEFGNIVSNTFDTETTQSLHEFELLLLRINAMFKMTFIFMLFFLVLLV